MAPGLSGLLARHLTAQLGVVDEIHVAMHGTGGPACARQHHRALGGTSLALHDGEWVRRPAGAGRELCWFPEPVNAYDCYRAEMPEPTLLHRVLPDGVAHDARGCRPPVATGSRRSSRCSARLTRKVASAPCGSRCVVRCPSGARETLIAGTSVRSGVAAALVAATMTRWALSGDSWAGVVVLGDQRLPTAALLDEVQAAGVRLFSFTGVARSPEG